MITKKEIEVLKLKKNGLTQVQIAKKINIAQSTVSLYLTKAQRKIKQAREDLKIAKELGISVDEELSDDKLIPTFKVNKKGEKKR